MKVLDHEPYRWFLLEDSGNFFLDVNCNHRFFGYDWLIELTPEETHQYQLRGRDYLHWLSEDIHNQVPILKGSTSIYKTRGLSPSRSALVNEAIEAWRLATHARQTD